MTGPAEVDAAGTFEKYVVTSLFELDDEGTVSGMIIPLSITSAEEVRSLEPLLA